MAKLAKFLQAAAGAAGGAGLDIDEVFSTYLYSGNSSAQTITNGIDLAGEGGLWWLKVRSQAGSHALYDSTRATGSEHFPLFSNNTSAEYDDFDTTPTSTGFTINSTSSGTVNETGQDYTSWTFRKAPKFFDVVTYTGNGVNGREIAHDLGCDVGFMIVKRTDAASSWHCWHNSGTTTNGYIELDQASSYSTYTGLWNNTSPTSTGFTLGTDSVVNASGGTYVAYIFAHNDGDGDFGPDGDQDIIKCGSYTGDDADDGPEINLGFEPQWLLVKNTSTSRSWVLVDSMRGIVTGGPDNNLYPNTTSTEDPANGIRLTATGFKCDSGGDNFNGNGHTMIYMAIRRGQLAVPEDATEVFDVKTRINADPSYVSSTGVVDMAIDRYFNTLDDSRILSRLTGKNNLDLNNNTIESTNGYTYDPFDFNTGWFQSAGAAETNRISWMWKRAPGYFDVVCWDAESTANRRLKHNLGVIPEMVWIKNREMMGAYTESWYVYHKDVGSNGFLSLNETDDNTVTSAMWPSPSATEFGIRENAVWNAGTAMIGYFFATVDGISKVGSFTGNGSSQTINCGFTAGSRFILIKRTDANGNWVVFDSLRGIVSGNTSYLLLNDRQAENASYDIVDPDSSGFIINQETQNNLNVNGANYIFYAIA